MNIGSIDASATLGRSWLHAASPVAKLIAFVLTLLAVVVSWNLLVVLAVLLCLIAVVTSAGLRPGLTYGLAAYPALFALIFAVSSAPDLLLGILIVIKAVAAALAAVTIVLSTPYPYVFAPVQRIVPTIVGDALLMTYRSLFLLLEKFSNLLTAIRLRAGWGTGHPVRSARVTVGALGGLMLYSFDLARRDYDIMRLRGYEGRLRVSLPRSASPARDALLVAFAALLLATSVLWRLSSQQLNPYSWLPAVAALLPLAAAVLTRWRSE